MKYFISFKARDRYGEMITGNCEVILDSVIDMDAIAEIEANILKKEITKL